MEKKITSFYKFFITFFIVLNTIQISAQKSKIYKLNEDKLEIKATLANDKKVDFERLYSLLYDLHPVAYIEKNEIKKVFGNTSPVKLVFEDLESFNLLHIDNSLFHDVELITVSLNSESDLHRVFDLSEIKGFNNLKYIYIQCYFKCTTNKIESFVLNSDSEFTIFYIMLNPS